MFILPQATVQASTPVSIDGKAAKPPEIPAEVAALTPREKEVFTLIGQGANNREIAKQMHLSEGTIQNYVTSLLSQLGLRDRTLAALLAQSIHHI